MDRDSWSGPDIPSPIPPETGSVILHDPPLGDDFATPSGSPAEGAGRGVEGDFPDHRAAYYDSPPTIGAFEAR